MLSLNSTCSVTLLAHITDQFVTESLLFFKSLLVCNGGNQSDSVCLCNTHCTDVTFYLTGVYIVSCGRDCAGQSLVFICSVCHLHGLTVYQCTSPQLCCSHKNPNQTVHSSNCPVLCTVESTARNTHDTDADVHTHTKNWDAGIQIHSC